MPCYRSMCGRLSDITLCPKISGPPSDGDNFVKTKPIVKILSPLERGLNCKQNPQYIPLHSEYIAALPVKS